VPSCTYNITTLRGNNCETTTDEPNTIFLDNHRGTREEPNIVFLDITAEQLETNQMQYFSIIMQNN